MDDIAVRNDARTVIEPKLGKHPANERQDFRMMTWDTFLTVREWAQEVANDFGYPVFLVGSALRKLYPRDIDITIIMPLADFEERFGKIPETEDELNKYLSHPSEVFTVKIPYWGTLQERIRWVTRVDLKIMPDAWFGDRDRLMLAKPNGRVDIRRWEMLRHKDTTP